MKAAEIKREMAEKEEKKRKERLKKMGMALSDEEQADSP